MKELGPIDQTKAGDFQLHSVTEETSKVTNFKISFIALELFK